MSSSPQNFFLSCELKDHTSEIRSISPYPVLEGGILTCSLDNTAKVWQRKQNTEGVEYEVLYTLIGHTNFVIDIAYFAFSETSNIVSISHDKSIIFWKMDGTIEKRIENAHDGNLSCMATGPNGILMTGSWDQTAKVWKKDECILHLKGHAMNVLCVLVLSNGNYVTGCGDGSIKIWDQEGKEITTLKKHTSGVRSLVEVPEIGFASTSNDCNVIMWSLDGTQLSQFKAHSNLVYSAAILPLEEMATSSEDKTVRVWKYGKCVQSIEHPGCVWKVNVLPNGDVITACSDSIGRVFTRDKNRMANQEAMKSYLDGVKNSRKTIQGIDVNSLPRPEALQSIKGTKDGETKLVNQDGTAVAYMWSASKNTWEKFGVVTDGTPGVGDDFSGKEYLDGKMYDYVFNIEIDEGLSYKLGYNLGENPYAAAQQFIYKHNLSQYALDTIAKFIIDNTPQNLAGSSSGPLGDPFTGYQAHRSTEPSSKQQQQQQQQQKQPSKKSTSTKDYTSFGDVFSDNQNRGTDSGQKEKEEREKQKTAKHFPRSYMQLDVGNFNGIAKKLREFNATIAADQKTKHLAMSETEVKYFNESITILTEVTLQKRPLKTEHLQIYDKLLEWPLKNIFPVLDLLRLVILLESATAHFANYQNGEITAKIASICFIPQANDVLHLMGLRFFTNMFSSQLLRYNLLKYPKEILDAVTMHVNPATERTRSAYASLLHNFAVFYGSTSNHNFDAIVLLLDAIKVAITCTTPLGHDVYYTLFCAVGSLIHQDKKLKELAKAKGFLALANEHAFSVNAKLCGVCYQLTNILK